MYEKDGEKYFVVDSHCHFWDASRENWKPGQRAVRQGLDRLLLRLPPARPARDALGLRALPQGHARGLRARHVHRGPRRRTRSSSRPTSRSGTPRASTPLDQNGELAEKYGDQLIVNGRFDPREGDAGLKQLEEDAKKYNLKGVKLYTAEWYDGSRGWKLTDPEAYRFLEKCQELGIKNIHVHKGPTIWPLDKDAFDVADVDHAATDFQDLNFIVEHAGIPRIEDFCFMAVQEPNVYAGLLGGDRRPHARPAEVLRQGHGRAAVLGRRGQDDSSAATTTSGRRSGRSRASSTGRCPTTRRSPTTPSSPRPPRRRSSASTPRSSTTSRCRPELQLPTTAGEDMQPGEELVEDTAGAQA